MTLLVTAAKSRSTRQMAVATVLGAVLGLAVLMLGPSSVLRTSLALVVLITAFAKPELLVLGLLCLVLGVLPERFNPYMRLAGRGFFASDLMLIMLLTVIAFRLIADKEAHWRQTPLDAPVLAFCVSVMLAMANAVVNHGVSFSDATYEARILLYYLAFFAVTNLVRTRAQVVWLVRGLLIIGVLVACTVWIQTATGREIYASGGKAVVLSQGVIRLYHPGSVAMYVAFMVLVCRSATQRQRAHQITSLVIVTMLGLGIILLLARNILISGSIGFAVLFLTLRNSESSRLAKALLLVGGIIVTAVTLLTISGNESWLLDYVGTLATRVSRLLSGRALSSEETLLPRWKEIEYAWLHIASNPILGIGLETAYRPPFYAGDILTAFIHNAYVWIWLKTGLLGLASFLWLSGLSLWRGFRSWRHVQDDLFRAVVLGSTLAYLSMMISNLVAPLFVQDWGLAIFAVMLGTNEVILLNHRVADEQGGAHDTE